jgi:hypothetical protein
VGFYLDAPAAATVSVRFQDSRHRSVLAASGRVPNQSTTLAFWPVGSAEVAWLPRDIGAERGVRR